MECDENVNVLSLWWNEGTCHLMGYDYKEYFQTLPPFTPSSPDDLKHTMTAFKCFKRSKWSFKNLILNIVFNMWPI